MTVENKATAEVTVANSYTEPEEEDQKAKDTLTIIKLVRDAEGKDLTANAKGQEYSFTVTGTDIYGNDQEFTVAISGTDDKVGTTLRKAVEVIQGTYTVTENDVDEDGITGYTWNEDLSTLESGRLEAEGTGITATITNVYDRDLGSLTIEKRVSSLSWAIGYQMEFEFTITGPKDANGTYSGVEFTNGTATVTITGEGKKTIEGLPSGVYTVEEDTDAAAVSGTDLTVTYLDSDKSGETDDGAVTVLKGSESTMVVTNKYLDDGEEREEPEENIDDPDVPTTDLPDLPDEPEVEIPDEDVPLAETPQTGDTSVIWILAAAVSGIGLVWLGLTGKKRKEEEAE